MEAMRGASSLISISADSLYTSAMKAVHCNINLPFRNMSFVTLKSIVDLDTWESSSCGMAKYLVLYTKLSFAICKNSKEIVRSVQQVFHRFILRVRLKFEWIKFELVRIEWEQRKEKLFSWKHFSNAEDLIRKLLSFIRGGEGCLTMQENKRCTRQINI